MQASPSEIGIDVARLRQEATDIFKELVLPTWGGPKHGFPETLYAFMMNVFSKVALLSALWQGSFDGQTDRMIDFLDTYFEGTHEAHSVAVQMWRHKLMHTAGPRYLRNRSSGKTYRFLLHWAEHLPRDHHWTFAETSDSRILNLALLYLVGNLEQALAAYSAAVSGSAQLQANQSKVASELANYVYREL